MSSIFFCIFFGELKWDGHSFLMLAILFLRDAWIQTQRAAVASRRATNLASHLHSYLGICEITVMLCMFDCSQHLSRSGSPVAQHCQGTSQGEE
jgi:hypothetical protein